MTDWTKDELAFEGEENLEEAIYAYGGDCVECGQRTFYCTSKDRADNEVGSRLTAFVVAASNEPPVPYCQDCVLVANPNIAEHVAIGIDAQRKEQNMTDFERYLRQLTAAMGGVTGE